MIAQSRRWIVGDNPPGAAASQLIGHVVRTAAQIERPTRFSLAGLPGLVESERAHHFPRFRGSRGKPLYYYWMMRSYAITLTFLVDRVLDLSPTLLALDADTSPNMLWLSEILAWVVPTIIIELPRIIAGRGIAADSVSQAPSTEGSQVPSTIDYQTEA